MAEMVVVTFIMRRPNERERGEKKRLEETGVAEFDN